MESKYIGRVFTHETDPDLCHVVETSFADEAVVDTYGGDGTLADFTSFLTTENIDFDLAVDRVRSGGHG